MKHAFDNLKSDLQWPHDCESGEEAIRMYTFRASEILGAERLEEEAGQKRVLKVLVEKMPTYFQLNHHNFRDVLGEPSTL